MTALRAADRPGLPRRLLTFPALTLHPFAALPSLLAPGDLVVVNDAATLPASLTGTVRGAPIELRLSGQRPDGAWEAVRFGAGDWHVDTDLRDPPPAVLPGDRLAFATLTAVVVAVPHPRRVVVRFDGPADTFWPALYREGHPVQYRHLAAALDVWDVQTPYAGPPWAVEPPSAGLALTVALIGALRARDVDVVALTEAAGLSATGDTDLDAALPFPERYAVPAATWSAVERTCARRHATGTGRVVAVGTSVVRALETVARTGVLAGVTDLHLGADNPVRVVHGLVSGVHAPGSSHHALLDAVLVGNGLDRAGLTTLGERAADLGLRDHELGDGVLILG
ncbi:MAG: S-adenosylmethionine:tRNA ribosyltransferase-isomerase [Pseudomonadota bacterium]|nr:S-adenosylmethionine:tRNA ribosyltransferase-isomerase [Pseudomonadota bacterium]